MFNNPTLHLTKLSFKDLELYISMDGACKIDSADWPGYPTIWGLSSTRDHYIAPSTTARPHIIPQFSGVPVLKATDTWEAPSEARIQHIRNLVLGTTHIGELAKPEWSRITHFVSLHEDKYLPQKTPLNKTDMGWQNRHFSYTYGGQPHLGWYHQANFRSGANGYDNNHYERIFWMGVRLIFERNKDYRDKVLWPYFVQNAIAHLASGHVWGGTQQGAARDEKGTHYVGDTNRNPFSKIWVMNLIMPFLLINEHNAFEKAIRDRAAWWFRQGADKVWKGYWGVRQAARFIEDLVNIALVMPDLRPQCAAHIKDMLNNLSQYMDRSAWVWPNKGNGGGAEESPWMAAQAVSACFRAWELIAETRGVGPTADDLNNIMKVIYSDYGSEVIGGYRVVRYRYHTNQDRARYIANTAWCVPALRFLVNHDPSWAKPQYDETKRLMQDFGGAHLSELAAGTAPAPQDIGFRFPSQGGAWSKTILALIESVR